MEQAEMLFMPQLAEKLQHVAPSTWRLVFALVGALNEWCLCLATDPMDVNLPEIFEESEQDLGELGEDTPADETLEDVAETVEGGFESDQEPVWPQKRS